MEGIWRKMNLSIDEERFNFGTDVYRKTYDSRERKYRFFMNHEEMNVYQWNRAVNRYQPMVHKATHPNRIVRWIERHRWSVTRRLVAVNGSKFVMDIGCESGKIASVFASSCDHLVLLDVDQELLSSIRPKVRGGSVTCVAADIYQIPFADNSIDRVMCTEVLEHLTDPKKAVLEIERILRPGGRAVVSVPNDQLILWVKKKLMHVGLGRLLGSLSQGLAMGHLHVFDKGSLVPLFDRRLKAIRCFYNFPWFTNIFLVAEKR